MRGLALALLLALPAAAAFELTIVYVEETEGRTLAPTSPFVTPPTAHVFPFDVVECYPHLRLDLRYEPDHLSLETPRGSVDVSYEFRAEVWHEGERVLEKRVQSSTHDIVVGSVGDRGAHELRLSLGWGADVAWELRLRGLRAQEDPACNPPLG